MKTMKNVVMIILLVFAGGNLFAQKKIEEITIKSSTLCDMCKEKIEKNLTFEKGVKLVKVDLDASTVYVKYRTDKTTPDEIRKAISLLGYRADDVPANKEAFDKLPECCKKEGSCDTN